MRKTQAEDKEVLGADQGEEIQASGDAFLIADAIRDGLYAIAAAIRMSNTDEEPQEPGTYLDGTRI